MDPGLNFTLDLLQVAKCIAGTESGLAKSLVKQASDLSIFSKV